MDCANGEEGTKVKKHIFMEMVEAGTLQEVLDEPRMRTYREVIQLRYMEGLTPSEIASRLGTTGKAVSTKLWNAKLQWTKSPTARVRAPDVFVQLAKSGLLQNVLDNSRMQGFREIIKLRYQEGLTLSQISERVGATTQSVHSRLSRARKRWMNPEPARRPRQDRFPHLSKIREKTQRGAPLTEDDLYIICRAAAKVAVKARWRGPYPSGMEFEDMIQEVTMRTLKTVAKFTPKVRKNGKVMTAPEYAYVAACYRIYDIGREVGKRIEKKGEVYDAWHRGLVTVISTGSRKRDVDGLQAIDAVAHVDFKGNKHGLAG